jgi:glutathione S-transferase
MASQYKDQAHRRLVQYYRHLLPELFQELDAGLAPSDVSGKDEPTLADYQLGWASQPEVSNKSIFNNKIYQIELPPRLLFKLQRKFEFSCDLHSFVFEINSPSRYTSKWHLLIT